MLVKDNGKGDFESPEPGTYGAVCVKIIDIGTQTSEYQGKSISRRQFIVGWELDEKMSDGKPFVISKFYTNSLNEKATLRKDLESWRGIGFTEDEVMMGYDVKNLIGMACMLSLVKNDKGKIRVSSVSKLPKGMVAIKAENPSVYFSLEKGEFDKAVFEGLSEGYKKLILQSPEYQAIVNGADPLGKVLEEEAPFA